MKRNRNSSTWLQIVLTTLVLSCGSDSSDPDTISRGKLSPPLKLVTVTGSNQIELRWSAQNFESELAGYQVFMASDSTLAAIAANTDALPGYPSRDYTEVSNLSDASVPRCEDNNAFFALFGIEVSSDSSCSDSLFGSDDDAEEESSLVGSKTAGLVPLGTTLLQEEETASITDAKLTCYDPAAPTSSLGSETVSLVKADTEYQDGEGIQRCLIKEDAAGTALANGTSYVFIVVAVLGTDSDEISWTSNLVEDTPAPVVFSESISLDGDTNAEFVTISLPADLSTGSVSAADAAACSNAANTDACKLNGTNTTAASNALVIARDSNSSTYKQRHFISTLQSASSDATRIGILYRGPLTFDPVAGSDTVSIRTPGDEAISSSGTVYTTNGKTIPFYDNSVFDIVYTTGGSSYYGKVIIDNISYASAEVSSTSTFTVTIVMQTKPDTLHYFQ